MKKSKNYLDFVPVLNPRNTWEEKKEIVTVHMVHRGLHHTLAQKLFRAPRVSHIALDAFGSFLWTKIDGVRSVGDLAYELKEKFGDEAEPLYDRLIQYMKILQNNHFIMFTKK
ncbi:MAG: PqqD family protein [Lachnospiraceae bacterium]